LPDDARAATTAPVVACEPPEGVVEAGDDCCETILAQEREEADEVGVIEEDWIEAGLLEEDTTLEDEEERMAEDDDVVEDDEDSGARSEELLGGLLAMAFIGGATIDKQVMKSEMMKQTRLTLTAAD
jgi:hypothetical protein